MTSYICIATLNIQQLGNDLDVTTEKLKTDEDSGFENDDQDQEESNDDIHPEIPIANGTSIKRDLVLSTTSKGIVDGTSDQNDNSGIIVQGSPDLGNGLMGMKQVRLSSGISSKFMEFHVTEQGFLAMNETHGMILQKLDEILTKLDKLTSNQVNNQDVGFQGDVNLVKNEGQPDEPYRFPDLTQNPEYDQFMIPQFAPLKPQRKPNKNPHNLGDYDFFL